MSNLLGEMKSRLKAIYFHLTFYVNLLQLFAILYCNHLYEKSYENTACFNSCFTGCNADLSSCQKILER